MCPGAEGGLGRGIPGRTTGAEGNMTAGGQQTPGWVRAPAGYNERQERVGVKGEQVSEAEN